jgi:hypothetical protein
MPGKTVGIQMYEGFPGTYSRSDNNVKIRAGQVRTTDTANVNFGDPVVLIQNNTGGLYSQMAGFVAGGGTFSFAPNGTSAFAGFAVREVKSFEQYTGATLGYYAPGAPADVIVKGSVVITVKNPQAAPIVASGPVFIRTAANVTYPSAAIGDVEPKADGTNTVALTNVVFTTGIVDANNVAEVELLIANIA